MDHQKLKAWADRLNADMESVLEEFDAFETLSPEDRWLLGRIDAAHACMRDISATLVLRLKGKVEHDP